MTRQRLIATGALVAVTVVWGATFVIVKEAIEVIPPYEFLAIRFIVASAVLAALIPKQVRATGPATLRAGAIAGIALGAGYGFQTVGLQFTSATKAGFITGLFVVFTPPLAAVMLRRAPTFVAMASTLIAAFGLFLLTVGRLGAGFNFGDLLVGGCAISFALHVVILGKIAKDHRAGVLAVFQLGIAGLAFALISVASEELVWPSTAQVWFALAITSLLASSAAYLIQTWAQKHLSPTQTAVTLTMEPVFAGVAGFLILDERLSSLGWLGAGLILAAMLLASRPQPSNEPLVV